MQINKNFWVLALAIISVFTLWIINNDYLLLGIWIALLLLISWSFIITRISLNQIEVQRISKIRRQQVGSYFNERLKVINNSSTHKNWVEISIPIDHKPISQARVFSEIRKKSVRIFNTPILLKNRGVYKLGPEFIQSGDPFGLFSIKKQLSLPLENLVVYPYFERIDNFSFNPGTEIGGSNLRKQTPKTTPQAAGIREYFPGDPLNRIHWPRTVKMNKLMVKEFDEDTQSNVWIFLDAQKGIHFRAPVDHPKTGKEKGFFFVQKKHYQLPCDSLEYAISTAASVSEFFIRKNRSVGLVCNNEDLYHISPENGRNQFIKIIDTLTLIEDNGQYPITMLLEKQIKRIPRGSSIILITPLSSDQILKKISTTRSRGIKNFTILIRTNSFIAENREESRGVNGTQITAGMVSINYGDSIRRKFT